MAEKRGVTKITPELESHTDSKTRKPVKITPELESHTDSKTRKPVESTAFKLSARRQV